jgi:hypothetical protein
MQNYVVVAEDQDRNDALSVSSGGATQSSSSSRLVRLPGSPTRHSPPIELSLAAFQESMAFSYFNETCLGSLSWRLLFAVDAAQPYAEIRSTANRALVYGFMGVGHLYLPLKKKGMELYCQALRQSHAALAASLSKPCHVELATLPLALLSLTSYSVSWVANLFKRCEHWLKYWQYAVDRDHRLPHSMGIGQVIEHCGPEAFQTEPSFTSFRACRAILVSISHEAGVLSIHVPGAYTGTALDLPRIRKECNTILVSGRNKMEKHSLDSPAKVSV